MWNPVGPEEKRIWREHLIFTGRGRAFKTGKTSASGVGSLSPTIRVHCFFGDWLE
jgi:hypothetical protein